MTFNLKYRDHYILWPFWHDRGTIGQISVEYWSITCLFLAHVTHMFRTCLARVSLPLERDMCETCARRVRDMCETDTPYRGFMEGYSTYYLRLLSSICSGNLSRVNTGIHLFLNKILRSSVLLPVLFDDTWRGKRRHLNG